MKFKKFLLLLLITLLPTFLLVGCSISTSVKRSSNSDQTTEEKQTTDKTTEETTPTENLGTEGLSYQKLWNGNYGVGFGTADNAEKNGLLRKTAIVIPDTYKGRKVTEILEDGFSKDKYDKMKLTKITFGKYIEVIDQHAFSGTNLATVELPGNLAEIQKYAFFGCTKLTTVSMPDTVTSIGECAFSGCSELTTVHLSTALTEIEPYTFTNCHKLSTINFPTGLTAIGTQAFMACRALTTLDLEDLNSLTNIYKSAFNGCTNLTAVTLPDNLIEIGELAFAHCENLPSIVIPKNINQIGNQAFRVCDKLNLIDIQRNRAFSSAFNKSWNQDCHASVIYSDDIRDGDFVYLPTQGEYGDGYAVVAYLGSEKTINVPESYDNKNILTIADSAFYRRLTLIKINLPSMLERIGAYAFANCSRLSEVNLPSGTRIVDNNAFSDCAQLETVFLPEEIVQVGHTVFYNCNQLARVYCGAAYPSNGVRPNSNWQSDWIGSNQTIIWDCDDIDDTYAYKKNDVGTYEIIDYREYNLTNPTATVTVPNRYKNKNIVALGKNAFSGSSVVTVNIPDTITRLDGRAFADCANLTTVNLPDTITFIGANAFTSCSNLSHIELPDGIQTVGDRAFANCSKMEFIFLPTSITTMGSAVFESCNSSRFKIYSNGDLSILPDGWNENWRSDCSATLIKNIALTADYIYQHNTTNNTYSIYLYRGTDTQITIPETFNDLPVTQISPDAFRGKTQLTAVTLSDNLTTIGSYAFAGCTQLTSILLPYNITTIGSYAFTGCGKLKTINCQAGAQPEGWDENWLGNLKDHANEYVHWNYIGD